MKKGLIVCLLFVAGTAMAQEISLTVKAGDYTRRNIIVKAALDKPLLKNTSYQLLNPVSKLSAPVQQLDSNNIMFILPDVLPPGKTVTYRLVKAIKNIKPPVQVERQPTGLLIKVHGKKVFFYNTALIPPPDTLPAYYARSGFTHPLYSPSGNILTDDFPAGHAHQHGIMMAWPNTTFKGQPHDFWNQPQKTANVKHIAVDSIEEGPVAAVFHLRLQQYSLTYGEVLSEKWTLTIYPFEQQFVFDLYSRQQNTTPDTLFMNKHIYGSIAFRGSRQWNDADPLHYRHQWKIETDSGFNLTNADGHRAAYVSAYGQIDETVSNATVFGFPSNYNYPQPIRVHPVMPYWGFAPAATGPFNILPGQVYTSRYRYCVADGPPDTVALREMNNVILHPVAVSVSYKKK